MTMPNDHEHAVCGEVRDNAALVAHIRRLTEQSPVESDPSLTTVDYNDLSLFADQIAALTAELERVRAETIEKCIAAADKRVRAASGVSYTTAVCELQAIPDDLRALAGEGV